MRRSARWRRRRQQHSSSAALTPVRVPAEHAARLVTGAGTRLDDGVVVEADLRARILGLKLLRVEASVVLLPASVQERSSTTVAQVVPGERVVHLDRARDLLQESASLVSRARAVSG